MEHLTGLSTVASFLLLSVACASAPKPHDMSAAQHEAEARKELAAAEEHDRRYDPHSVVPTQVCVEHGTCWTSVRNPTAKHRSDAAAHEKHALEHRAAAKALLDAEASACQGMDESELVTSPFYHREDISEVSKADLMVNDGLGTSSRFAGGRAVFRAVPGLTGEWLQRLIDCHMARAASVGFSVPEMDYCPLVLKGVTAKVSSTGTGFAVTVTSEDPKTAQEIWRRIEALKGG